MQDRLAGTRVQHNDTPTAFCHARRGQTPEPDNRSEINRIFWRSPSPEEHTEESLDSGGDLKWSYDWNSKSQGAMPHRISQARCDSPELLDAFVYKGGTRETEVSFYSMEARNYKGSIPNTANISMELQAWLLSRDCSPANITHYFNNFEDWAIQYHKKNEGACGQPSTYSMVMAVLADVFELFDYGEVPVDAWFKMPEAVQREWMVTAGISKIASEEGLMEWKLDDPQLVKRYMDMQEHRRNRSRGVNMSPPQPAPPSRPLYYGSDSDSNEAEFEEEEAISNYLSCCDTSSSDEGEDDMFD